MMCVRKTIVDDHIGRGGKTRINRGTNKCNIFTRYFLIHDNESNGTIESILEFFFIRFDREIGRKCNGIVNILKN